MSWVVGLTGGIASGKSAAGDCFQDLGVPLLDADQVSRNVVTPGSTGLAQLVRHFGNNILDAGGALDRAAMRRRVFDDPTARDELERILHPLIHQQLMDWSRSSTAPYAVLMLPLLVKKGWQDLVDRVLVIDCPVEMQLQRLLQRDDIDAGLAESMIAAQESRQSRLQAADDLILNAGSLDELKEMVRICHEQYQAYVEGRRNTLINLRLPASTSQVQ